MKKLHGTILATVLLAGAACAVDAAELVREFTGTRDRLTSTFTVEGPWIIDWRLDADYEQLVALDVTLIEARTGRHVGRVLHTKVKGNGVKLFRQGGTYQLRVSSTLARWRLRVEQLTPEEAELYTPKRPRDSIF
ncbi:MAG: hypothetical protein R3176_06310 [Woeseiaceae bacterium]|nr:hypothetical protein [Woeseiaceae bacterium]